MFMEIDDGVIINSEFVVSAQLVKNGNIGPWHYDFMTTYAHYYSKKFTDKKEAVNWMQGQMIYLGGCPIPIIPIDTNEEETFAGQALGYRKQIPEAAHDEMVKKDKQSGKR